MSGKVFGNNYGVLCQGIPKSVPFQTAYDRISCYITYMSGQMRSENSIALQFFSSPDRSYYSQILLSFVVRIMKILIHTSIDSYWFTLLHTSIELVWWYWASTPRCTCNVLMCFIYQLTRNSYICFIRIMTRTRSFLFQELSDSYYHFLFQMLSDSQFAYLFHLDYDSYVLLFGSRAVWLVSKIFDPFGFWLVISTFDSSFSDSFDRIGYGLIKLCLGTHSTLVIRLMLQMQVIINLDIFCMPFDQI